jgi:hypothetical protein
MSSGGQFFMSPDTLAVPRVVPRLRALLPRYRPCAAFPNSLLSGTSDLCELIEPDSVFSAIG